VKTIVLLALASGLFADTIELKTGERIEGAFKQATPAGVIIVVGGKALNFPLSSVRSIYFGSASASEKEKPNPAAIEAIDAVRGLRSVTEAGLNYSQYSQRVLDAKVRVDRFTSSTSLNDAELGVIIQAAMHYYELASRAWSAKISKNESMQTEVGLLAKADKCPAVRETVANSLFGGDLQIGMLMGEHLQVFWHCGVAKLAESESLAR
jgi:hypothetical protein